MTLVAHFLGGFFDSNLGYYFFGPLVKLGRTKFCGTIVVLAADVD